MQRDDDIRLLVECALVRCCLYVEQQECSNTIEEV